MASARTALAKIAIKEFAVGDYAGAIAMTDPLIRWDDRALDSDGQLVLGQEDVLAYLGRWMDGWEDYWAEVEEIREVGDRIVAIYTEQGIERSTGIEMRNQRAAVLAVERGAITGWSRYLSGAEAISAASASDVTRF